MNSARPTLAVLVLCAALLAPLLPARAAHTGPRVRRFALLAGANLGGATRVPLRYANADAEALLSVLRHLGGVEPEDALLVLDADRADFLAAVETLRSRLQAAAQPTLRREVVLYYSGHSDERGLLLGGEHLAYKDLRRALEGLPAEVRVAVLDSCASGALTRAKGGQRRPPFLVDAASDVRGLAILTSSSASETSQESDHIGASFFTHYLVSGLRGAADQDADRRVTLAEAYRFAFHETLARTEQTRGGAQHPAYDFQLVGTGDLVMTDLRSTAAGLTLSEDLGGRVWVRDAQGRLVVELRKQPGRTMELGLQPGRYGVRVEQAQGLGQAQIELVAGAQAVLTPQALSSEALEGAGPKGSPAPQSPATAASGEPPEAPGSSESPEAPAPAPLDRSAYRIVPVDLELMAPITVAGPDESPTITSVSLFLISGRTTRLEGLAAGIGVGVVDEDVRGVQAAVGANLTGGDLRGIQGAVGLSLTGGDLRGVQGAVGASLVGGSAWGLQAAVGASLVAQDLTGLQAAVGLSLTSGRVVGVQTATGASVAGAGFSGLQLAVGGTVASGPARGVQLSSGLNLAEELSGGQVGLVNVAGTLGGAQIGLVNVGKQVRGLQLGLVNVASELDGVPLGLINIIGDGLLRPQLWIEDSRQAHVGIKMGSRMLYTLLHAGIELQRENPTVSWGVGLGTRLTLTERLFVDGELVSRQGLPDGRWPDELHMQYQLRVTVGWKIAEHLRVVAGPSVNVLVSGERGAGEETFAPYSVLHDGDPLVHLWPGLHVGIEL